jgi:hypothetical protein
MKHIVKITYFVISLLFLIYLAYPNPFFPKPPESIRSFEPADIETPKRRAFYTDLTRDEIMSHYRNEFKNASLLGYVLPAVNLNYPPEEAWSIIREQTRSNFLEEIVHPFRNSIFVSGFEPKEDKDRIYLEDKFWKQKVTIRYVDSNPYYRIAVGLMLISLIPILIKYFYLSSKLLFKGIIKIWT